MADLKALQGVEIKDAAKGTVEAVFSRFNVKDLDGDVTRPGAFDDGAPVRISAYGHASWGPSRGASFVPIPPVGKGVIRTTADDAILQGQFFLGTSTGADTFELVKQMGDLQEWSYGYDVPDGGATKGEFEGEKVRFLDKLLVHEVSPVLLGAGVGTRTLAVKGAEDPPEGEEPDDEEPEGSDPKAKTMQQQADYALASVEAFVTRSRSLADLRAKEGRVLSAANRDRLATLADALGVSAKEIAELLTATDPNKHRAELEREYLRFEQTRARL